MRGAFRSCLRAMSEVKSVSSAPLELPESSNALERIMTRRGTNTNLVLELMKARVHMGHRSHLSMKHMFPYILGERNGMHVIDLDKTVVMLRRGMAVMREMVANNCTVMWVAPNRQEIFRIISPLAQKANAYFLKGMWVPGTLTDPIESRQAVRFGYKMPGCLFVFNTKECAQTVHEARLLSIPIVAITDTDVDPLLVTYPIPGNDESPQSIHLYAHFAMMAMVEGAKIRDARKFKST